MFQFDKPINSKDDDILNRENFSSHLGGSLMNWSKEESLVIALCGEWGSGKSSIINPAKKYIEDSKEDSKKPTIIEFNPWFFSDLDNMTQYFFNEIANKLDIENDDTKNKKLAEKLKLYAQLLQVVPKEKFLNDLSSKILLGLGLLSISTSQIMQWLNLSSELVKYTTFGLGFLLFLLGLFKDFLIGLSDYFSQKAILSKKSILELKEELKKDFKEKKRKLIIVIDDIDRLTQSEIKQIFRLVRVNADFPNTIYLLAFDRKIIEANLEEQVGVLGKDYLEKIIQVSFDIPLVKSEKIMNFLFQELDNVLKTLPTSHRELFNQEYCTEIYKSSGFKTFFKNIRDVKRFVSSLQFNISQMHNGEVMEVNPIDFIVIEGIRLFLPDLYNFIKSNKNFFIDIKDNCEKNKDREIELEEYLKNLDFNFDYMSIKELLFYIFPQLEGSIDENLYSTKLSVCARRNFDSYFTFIPGGDESELNQYEIECILFSMRKTKNFENLLKKYINEKKIEKVFDRILNYIGDPTKILQNRVQKIVQVFFNISDSLPEEVRIKMYDIILKLFKREDNKNKNYLILLNTIPNSKNIFDPIQIINYELENIELFLPKDKLQELMDLCIKGIKKTKVKSLLENQYFLNILYRWKDWDEKEDWKSYIYDIKKDENLKKYLDKVIEDAKCFKEYNQDLYQKNKEVFDLLLN